MGMPSFSDSALAISTDPLLPVSPGLSTISAP